MASEEKLTVVVELDDTTYLPAPVVDVWIDEDRDTRKDLAEAVELERSDGKWSGDHQVPEPIDGMPVVVYVRALTGTRVTVSIKTAAGDTCFARSKTTTGVPYLMVGELEG